MSNKENQDIPDRLISALEASNHMMAFSLQFATFQSTVLKVNFVSDLLETHKLLPKFIEDIKNNQKSVELRKEGNIFFTQMKFEDSLKSYTYSIANAVFSTEELGLAYANRSAVLFRLKLFEECLEDIQRALHNNYPENLKPKLLERQRNAENLKSKQQKIPHHQPIPKIPKYSRNATIECASNSVEIKNDATFGRHIIATRDIEIGEIIAVEQPAFTVLLENKWCHCHHCLNLCYCLIPCESCTEALFCSDVCKNNAKKYHDFECSILATVHSFDLNSCKLSLLPLRVAILMKNKYHNLYQEVKNNENMYMSGRYKEIHNLVTNEKSITIAGLFRRVVLVSLLHDLVKKRTKFFENFDNDSENIFKRLILHHLNISSNFHEIIYLEWKPELHAYKPKQIGVGAFGFLSLFNHSCAPKIQRVHYGRNIALYATASIRKGEQVFDDYGFNYGMDSKLERQALLKEQYFFDCRCRACENNWGTYDTLPSLSEGIFMVKQNELGIAVEMANLKVIRKLQPKCRNAAMRLQKKAPCREYFCNQELLKQSYQVFGNIRRTI